MASKVTEVVILMKAMTQGTASVRRMSADFARLGAQVKAAQALDATNIARQKQAMSLAQTNARITQGAIRNTRDLKQLDKELFDNQSQRWRMRNKIMSVQGDANAFKRFMLERDIEASYMRQNVLLTRKKLLTATQAADAAHLNAQLKLQELQLQKINAEYAEQALFAKRAAAAGPWSNTGRAMMSTGRTGLYAGGLATVGFAAASSRYAEFDRQATRAATQASNTVTQIGADAARLETTIMDLMKVYPASADQMTAAAYDIFSSLDITYGSGIKLLTLFNKAAVGGQVDLATATEASITVLENFDSELANNGKITQRTVEVMDYMFRIVKEGRMSFEDMQQIMSQVAPAAAAAGQNIEDIAASVSLLTRKLGVTKAGAGLARLIEVVSGEDFRAGMRKAGLAIDDSTGNLIAWEDVLNQIAQLNPSKFTDLIKVVTQFGRGKGQGIQSTVQARRAITDLIKFAKERKTIQDDLIKDAGEYQRSYEALAKTPGVQWQVMINQFKVLTLEIGRAAIPAIMSFLRWMIQLIDKWRALSPEIRDGIVKFSAFAAVLLLVVGPIAMVVGGLLRLIGVFRGMMVALGGGEAAAGAAAGVGVLGGLGRLAGLLKILKGIGIVTVGVHLLLNWDDVKKDFGRGDFMGPIFDAVGLGEDWDKVKTEFMQMMAESPISEKLGISGNIRRGMIEDLMASQGLDGSSIKEIHDQWFKMTVKDRRRIFNRFKSEGLGKELLHRISVGDLSEAFKPMKGQKGNKSQLDLWLENVEKGLGTTKTTTELNNFMKKSYDDLLNITKGYGDTDVKQLKKWREDRADVIEKAAEDAKSLLDQATDALVAKYKELRAQNQADFGTLFQGPWMTSETMNLAKEWGVKPQMQDLTRDVREQRIAFVKYNSVLGNIAKRGAPKELVKQLGDLGPEALDMLAEISRSSPTEFKKFVNEWKKGQAAITAATEGDFKTAMASYKTYGEDVVTAIVEGLDANDRVLQERFGKLIKDSFGSDVISSAIQEAVAEWEADNPKPTVTSPGKPTGGGGTTTGGGRTPAISAADYRELQRTFGVSHSAEAMTRLAARRAGRAAPPADDTKGSIGGGHGPVYNTYNLYALPNENPHDFVRRAAWRLRKGK